VCCCPCRSDTLHPAGPLTCRDLVSILPMMDDTVVIQVGGMGGQGLLTPLPATLSLGGLSGGLICLRPPSRSAVHECKPSLFLRLQSSGGLWTVLCLEADRLPDTPAGGVVKLRRK